MKQTDPVSASTSPITKDNLFSGGVALFLCGSFVVLHSVYLAAITHTPVLQYDEWRVLARYIELVSGKISLNSFLLEKHLGHRPVVSRLLFILDMETVGGTQVMTKIVSLSLWVSLVAVFASLYLMNRKMRRGIRLIGVGLTALVLMPNQQIYNLSIGWNNAIAVNICASVLALFLVIKSIHTTANSRRFFVLGACALFSGFVATFSTANGQLLWLLLLLLYVRSKMWYPAIIIAVIGVSLIAFSFSERSILFNALSNPEELLRFFATLLGQPALGLFGPEGAMFAGGLALLLATYIFFRQDWHLNNVSPTVLLLLGICLLTITTVGTISAARFTWGSAQALVPRYYSFVSPFWAAILLLAFILNNSCEDVARRKVLLITDAGVLVSSIVVCAAAYVGGPSSDLLIQSLRNNKERAATAIVAGAPDEGALKNIIPSGHLSEVSSSVRYLAINRKSVFRSDADYLLYESVHTALFNPKIDTTIPNGKWCVGAIELISRLNTKTDQDSRLKWHRVSGWAYDYKHNGIGGILFADDQGNVLGIGRMLFDGGNLATALGLKHKRSASRFLGYFEMSNSRSIAGYAFSPSQVARCRFGQKRFSSEG